MRTTYRRFPNAGWAQIQLKLQEKREENLLEALLNMLQNNFVAMQILKKNQQF